jgi:hypothetical protein
MDEKNEKPALNSKGEPVTDTVLEVQNGEHIVDVTFEFIQTQEVKNG